MAEYKDYKTVPEMEHAFGQGKEIGAEITKLGVVVGELEKNVAESLELRERRKIYNFNLTSSDYQSL